MLSKRHRKLRVAAPIAIAIAAVSASPAFAAPPDPQTTNIPQLGWRGENLRLVKCDDALARATSAAFVVEGWSGDPMRSPALLGGSVSFFHGTGVHAGESCVRGTFLTQGAGMAQIKLSAQDASGNTVLSHEFLAGWMNIEQPTLNGGGDFTAGGAGRELGVTVKGDMPMNGFGGINGSIVLPDGWATLAHALANDANASDAAPWSRWDIHDDDSGAEGHSAASGCTPLSADGMDAVDNCAGGLSFSNLFGRSTGSTIGPFDPERYTETLLANGSLNAGDAPMPAARIDVTIAPNSGHAGDISGVGLLTPSSKQVDYSRDGSGQPTPHNLYAPFYSAYIPATAAPVAEASGVDGPVAGNDFPGLLVDGQYTYWQIADRLATALGGNTGCTLRGLPNAPSYRQLPAGDQSVVVYSDEHGEARVTYNPGTGAYYDSLGLDNANQGCDLAGVDVLGTSSITATARYPGQHQVYAPFDQASAPVVARVHSLFSKTMAAYAKGAGSDNAVARIVVAHAQDVNGQPFANETVCFMADGRAEGLRGFFGTTGTASAPISLTGSRGVVDPFGGLGSVCTTTTAGGNAAVEVFNSNGGPMNVIAEFVDEGLLRHIDVDFGADQGPIENKGGGTGGSGSTTGGSGGSTGGGSGGSGGSTGGSGGGTTTKTAPAYRLAMARLVRPVGKRPYLLVRVNGPKGTTAQLHAHVYDAHHAAKGAFTHKVQVNQTVKVTSSKLTRKIRFVRVKL